MSTTTMMMALRITCPLCPARPARMGGGGGDEEGKEGGEEERGGERRGEAGVPKVDSNCETM